MARNKIEDLRDHLFAAIERLSDEDISGDKLQEELKKAKAISELSSAIVDTARAEIEFLEAVGATGSDSQLFKGVTNQNLLG
ncbi:MAG: hypothetical protein J0G96_07300 [Flavobacteriia bacterium]|nr:hypothetical protein [Flavobacteriia bacterium]OJX36672.1 MAG: hypothetical protein BGO87_12810 [Flavobacteriia bacterium 40-80]